MFGDYVRVHDGAEDSYVRWDCAVENMLREDPTLRLGIVEIGCGLNVCSLLAYLFALLDALFLYRPVSFRSLHDLHVYRHAHVCACYLLCRWRRCGPSAKRFCAMFAAREARQS